MDMGAGYIPVLGTMVDIAFKANLANLAILEAHLRSTPRYIRPNMSCLSDRHSFNLQVCLSQRAPTAGLVAVLVRSRKCKLGLAGRPNRRQIVDPL